MTASIIIIVYHINQHYFISKTHNIYYKIFIFKSFSFTCCRHLTFHKHTQQQDATSITTDISFQPSDYEERVARATTQQQQQYIIQTTTVFEPEQETLHTTEEIKQVEKEPTKPENRVVKKVVVKKGESHRKQTAESEVKREDSIDATKIQSERKIEIKVEKKSTQKTSEQDQPMVQIQEPSQQETERISFEELLPTSQLVSEVQSLEEIVVEGGRDEAVVPSLVGVKAGKQGMTKIQQQKVRDEHWQEVVVEQQQDLQMTKLKQTQKEKDEEKEVDVKQQQQLQTKVEQEQHIEIKQEIDVSQQERREVEEQKDKQERKIIKKKQEVKVDQAFQQQQQTQKSKLVKQQRTEQEQESVAAEEKEKTVEMIGGRPAEPSPTQPKLEKEKVPLQSQRKEEKREKLETKKDVEIKNERTEEGKEKTEIEVEETEPTPDEEKNETDKKRQRKLRTTAKKEKEILKQKEEAETELIVEQEVLVEQPRVYEGEDQPTEDKTVETTKTSLPKEEEKPGATTKITKRQTKTFTRKTDLHQDQVEEGAVTIQEVTEEEMELEPAPEDELTATLQQMTIQTAETEQTGLKTTDTTLESKLLKTKPKPKSTTTKIITKKITQKTDIEQQTQSEQKEVINIR